MNIKVLCFYDNSVDNCTCELTVIVHLKPLEHY